MTIGIRNRSRIVCLRCHARKNGRPCTNCEKRSEDCRRREHAKLQRQSQHRSSPGGLPDASELGCSTTPAPILMGPVQELDNAEHDEERRCLPAQQPPTTSSDDLGYIGEFSDSQVVGHYSQSVEAQMLAAARADELPPRPLLEALISSYFKYLYHRIPVVDRRDSLCLAGSVLQSERFYTKAKTLFYTNNERDPLTIVKALCLLTLWNVTPPAVVTIDCSWNWLGLAIRLAFQMGLHRESTYQHRRAAGCARRIAWFLYAQDKMLSACFGRPQMMKPHDFDLRRPLITDFEGPENGKARLFILYTDLTTILAKMMPFQNRAMSSTPEEVSSIPPDLRLMDDDGMRIYDRAFYEILIWYLTCIITLFHVHGRFFHPMTRSTIGLVASSCIIRLYQEMDFRDDINYLAAINNWSMMVASLPQLHDIRRESQTNVNAGDGAPDKNTSIDPLSLEELDIILEILTQRTVKFPGANAIVERILRLKSEALCTNGSTHPLPELDDIHGDPQNPNWRTPRMELLSTLEAEESTNGLFDSLSTWSVENLLSLDDFFNPMLLGGNSF
ncbi:fungal-specific transcription factor domain-containing protein [Aspergillus ambiguus]|uniref:Zn(II)2Cys6 transcription factor n=1 Tax=Aspergillus ambiguus TaxID=176160 RepID=UPI003CCD21FB